MNTAALGLCWLSFAFSFVFEFELDKQRDYLGSVVALIAFVAAVYPLWKRKTAMISLIMLCLPLAMMALLLLGHIFRACAPVMMLAIALNMTVLMRRQWPSVALPHDCPTRER